MAPPAGKKKILFVCVHNSARSQMAEAFLRKYGSDRYEAESAGLEPRGLNPLAVEAMREVGIDISGKHTNDVSEFLAQGRAFDYVVTVCDETSGERCPIFPGAGVRLHWSFDDPSSFTGTHEEKLRKTRIVRDAVEERVLTFLGKG